MNVKDLTGKIFGRLVVVRRDGYRGANAAWLCQCECRKEKTISSKHLMAGVTRSCGCLAKESAKALVTKMTMRHGGSRTKVYKVWTSMIQRCTNEKDKYFYNYGGRGILVCERWRNDYAAFIEDMGYPAGGMTLDRIDNNKGYEPENCRWIDRHEQMRNTRRTVIIEFNGEKLCAKDWAVKLGFKHAQTITERLKRGWSVEKALTTPTS